MLLAAFLSVKMLTLAGCGQNSEDGKADIFEGHHSEETEENTWTYYGCWEYQDDDLWLCIYNDGTCEWYDAEGLYGVDSYYVEDGILYLEQEDVTYEAKFGGLIASNGSTLFSSLLPDYDGTAMNGGEDFLGCWEDAIDDVWLEINSDGTYLFMWDDGYGSAGDCSVKNKFFTLGFVAFAALQQRFCFAKPAPIPTERKLSLSESYGNLYGRRRALSGKRDALCL